MMRKTAAIFLGLCCLSHYIALAQSVSGVVRDGETRIPVPFATVYLLDSKSGINANEEGLFSIPSASLPAKIIVSSVGYTPDTLEVKSYRSLTVYLRPDARSLQEVVVVSGTLKEVSKLESAIPVEIYSPALFLKNPSPGIFESLGMINGVQPQVNCNVCNTGDIHINGMEGPYTMVLIDGMPIVSSLATVYGLFGIPNSLVKRIEVVKGPASTLYGSEAVGGLINIITKEPSTAPRFYTDISTTTIGENNFDFSAKWKMGNHTALAGVNYFKFGNRLDINNDQFTDVTLQDRISVFNKYDLSHSHGRTTNIAWRYVYEDRWGGEVNWTKANRGGNEIYGESIYTHRAEIIGNHQLSTKEKIFLDFSYNYHFQDSYYGTTLFEATQHTGFVQMRWDKKIGNHDLLAGIPLRYILYDDNTPGTQTPALQNAPMRTWLPGIFVQDEYKLSSTTSILGGLRYDHHNRHGNIFAPRLSLKMSPSANHTLRLSTGNGFRVVNLFTEDHAALTGARQVIIRSALRPERSWNVNLNYATNFQTKTGFAGFDVSAFYTYFTNKIVGDFLTNPEQIIYDNLNGYAVSRGLTFNADIVFTSALKLLTGVTVMDVYQVEDGIETPQLFAPRVSGTYALSYVFEKKNITIDLTGRLNGPMHLPVLPDDFRPSKSPWFTLMNIQITKQFRSGLELYGGAKNLLNFIPQDPIYGWDNPFDQNFDASYNYAPVQGIRGFAGVRYTIQ